MTWTPYFLILFWIDFALCGFTFLLTWRIARRFGARGWGVVLVLAAVLGSVRDFRYWASWGTG